MGEMPTKTSLTLNPKVTCLSLSGMDCGSMGGRTGGGKGRRGRSEAMLVGLEHSQPCEGAGQSYKMGELGFGDCLDDD